MNLSPDTFTDISDRRENDVMVKLLKLLIRYLSNLKNIYTDYKSLRIKAQLMTGRNTDMYVYLFTIFISNCST